jgi:hypothetical protein
MFVWFINDLRFHWNMPKGLKETSSLIQISTLLIESAPDTFTQSAVDLQLNPLDNEVFVVYAIDINAGNPDVNGNVSSATFASVSTTSRTTIGSMANSNVLGIAQHSIKNDGNVAVSFTEHAPSTPTGMGLEYIGIIATNDFFVQIQGQNNLLPKDCEVRVYGQRARADSSVYAALVQSEMLSS